MKYLSLLLFTAIAFSCTESEKDPEPVEMDESAVIEGTFEEEEEVEVIEEADLLPPLDKNKDYSVDILQTGIVDDVEGLDLESEWWGLFEKDGQWRIEKTFLTINKVHNPMLDAEGEATANEIVTDVEDECLVLWSDLDFLEEGEIEHVEIPQKKVYPGETVTFEFYDDTYKLTGQGDTDEYGGIENYFLLLERKYDGVNTGTFISDQPFFDDTMTEILFIGDIDGDEIVDLVLDDSPKYSYSHIVLFLSRPAFYEIPPKKIGEKSFFGC